VILEMRAPTLTIVVPCFNEAEALPLTAMRLLNQLRQMIAAGMIGGESHVLFVDDGSLDATWTLISQLNQEQPRFRGLKLSRNRGHQNALLAGLLHAEGDVVISIDADLQDDLEVMRQMTQKYAEGADIVLGVRIDRACDTPFKRIAAQAYYRFLALMKVEAEFNHADYRLMSRRAIEALRGFEETNLFLRGLVMQLGFRREMVRYARAQRVAGQSKYPLGRMLGLALEGVTAFSVMPLRYITILGFMISVASFLLGVWAFAGVLVFHNTVPGWASTVIPIYLICGVQMICLGVMVEYVGKIYLETKRRPRYLVEASLPGEQVASVEKTHRRARDGAMRAL
jgi:glycosyltransferase involved in cell wall biosynthesis